MGVCVCVCGCGCGCGCGCVVEALCTIYNFYFLLLIPHHCEMLESLEGHLQVCPMSIPLVEQSIFFGVCDLCRLSHPGHGPKPSSKGAGVEERTLSCEAGQAAVSGPCANLQIIASSRRELVRLAEPV